MSVLFTLVMPPDILFIYFLCIGVCTMRIEQIHIHSYFTLYEVIVYEVTVGRSDTDTYTPPMYFWGGSKRCLWGAKKNIHISTLISVTHEYTKE